MANWLSQLPPSELSLDEVIALHTEMAALVRAGVPLERGLAGLGRDLPKRLRHVTQQISQRLQQGEPLAQVLADPRTGLPPAYRIVVEAGLRSGQLSAALEDVATTARRAAELRRTVGVALIYPVLVALLAFGLAVAMFTFAVPRMLDAYRDLMPQDAFAVRFLEGIGENVSDWAPWPPLLIVLLLIGRRLWTRFGGRSTGTPRGWWRTSPSEVLRLGHLATFTDLLGMMLSHQVPLADALPLAAGATGRHDWQRGAETIAEQLRAGQPLNGPMLAAAGLPATVGWMVSTAGSISVTRAALSAAAASYRDQARDATQWLTQFLPMILTVVIGGTAVLTYGVVMFGPWFSLMRYLGETP